MICSLQLMPMWHVDSRDTLDTVSVCFGSLVHRPSHHLVFASSYILETIKNWLVGSPRNSFVAKNIYECHYMYAYKVRITALVFSSNILLIDADIFSSHTYNQKIAEYVHTFPCIARRCCCQWFCILRPRKWFNPSG